MLGAIRNTTNYTVTVSASTDLTEWTEILRFQSTTFARSFENFRGDFYFGLGCETKSLSTASGNILRVGRANFIDSVGGNSSSGKGRMSVEGKSSRESAQ